MTHLATDSRPPDTATVRTTDRLVLRPVAADDLTFLHELHGDPDTYRHYPQGRSTSLDQTAAMLDGWLEHWSEHGFGYWLAVDPATTEPVGMAGVIRKPPPAPGPTRGGWLNLGYRFTPRVHGRGLGRAAARESVAFATEWLPGAPVYALVRPTNVASRRSAESAGMSVVGRVSDVEGEEPSVVLQAGRVRTVDPDQVRDDLVGLWQRVNAAGGAVGFRGEAPIEAVRAAYDEHAVAVTDGRAALIVLTRPTGPDAAAAGTGAAAEPQVDELLGMGFLEQGGTVSPHRVTLQRLMVEPSLTGRNLGRLLLTGLHATAREGGYELAVLTVRGGTGTDAFYLRNGYREVGRIPRGLKFGEGADADYHDDIWLARRLDGSPL